MPYDLHRAAAQGDLEKIKSLSQLPNFNVNELDPSNNCRALDIAAQAGRLEVVIYLIEVLKAEINKPNDKKTLWYWANQSINVGLKNYVLKNSKLRISECFELFRKNKTKENFCLLEEAIKNDHEGIDDVVEFNHTIIFGAFMPAYAVWEGYRAQQTIIFKLLLQHGADISAGIDDILQCLKNGDSEKKGFLLAETVIRGDLGGYLQVSKNLKRGATLKEVEAQLDFRKLKLSQIEKIKLMLQNLISKHNFDSGEAKKILNFLQGKQCISIDPSEYPACLKDFLGKEYKITLADLALQIQYARGIIPSPYNEEQLKSRGENHLLALRAANLQAYAASTLVDFIKPKYQMKSLMEMRLYPEIVNWICVAALHSEISAENKINCISLLSRYENPSELEEAILSVSDVNFRSAQTIAAEVSELKETVSDLSQKLEATNSKLDLVLKLLGNHGVKPSSMSDVSHLGGIFQAPKS